MDPRNDRVDELQRQIADLKKRWPAHTVPPGMMQQLDDLEAELEEALREIDAAEDDQSPLGQH